MRQPALLIPYPDAKKLQTFLGNPFIRAALPKSISPPPKPAIRGDVSPDNSSRAWIIGADGRLSIIARELQRSVRSLSERLGFVMPATLYEDLPSISAAIDTAQTSEGRCALDQIDFRPLSPVTAAYPNGPLQINGWLVDARNNAPIGFMLMLEGPKTYQIKGKANVPRMDVAAALHSEAASNAGFSVVGALDLAAPGAYEIKLKINGAKGQSDSVCDTHHRVVRRRYEAIKAWLL